MTSYYSDIRQYNRTAAVLRLKYFPILFSLIIAAIALSSCEEKATIIGTNLLPPGDFTSTTSTDTISVFSFTYSVDSVRSNNKTLSYLGGLYDPYFGTSLTSFVGQLRILKDFKGGTDSVSVDSVKMYFTIAGAKGKLGTNQQLELYEIDEMLYDTSYYSNRDPHAGKYFGFFEIPKIKKDTAQEVFVELSKKFGAYLMRDTAKLFQDNPATDFRSYFKGLYVQMKPSTIAKGYKAEIPKDSLMLTALTFDQGDFLIRVYYEMNDADQYYDFVINPNSIRYNLYSHDFETAEPGKKINHVDDNVKDTLSYLQGFNGVYTKIKIPSLDSIKKLGRVSVNRAKVTIPVFLDNEIYTVSTVPEKIYMSYIASDGLRYIVPDYTVNPSFFDGSFSSTTKKYTFNLASFTQQYLEGKIPLPELDLYFPEGEYKNVILRANHSASKVRFEFTYTRF